MQQDKHDTCINIQVEKLYDVPPPFKNYTLEPIFGRRTQEFNPQRDNGTDTSCVINELYKFDVC